MEFMMHRWEGRLKNTATIEKADLLLSYLPLFVIRILLFLQRLINCTMQEIYRITSTYSAWLIVVDWETRTFFTTEIIADSLTFSLRILKYVCLVCVLFDLSDVEMSFRFKIMSSYILWCAKRKSRRKNGK